MVRLKAEMAGSQSYQKATMDGTGTRSTSSRLVGIFFTVTWSSSDGSFGEVRFVCLFVC